MKLVILTPLPLRPTLSSEPESCNSSSTSSSSFPRAEWYLADMLALLFEATPLALVMKRSKIDWSSGGVCAGFPCGLLLLAFA